MRDAGEVEIMQKGEVLGREVGLEDVKGPIRVRKKMESWRGDSRVLCNGAFGVKLQIEIITELVGLGK